MIHSNRKNKDRSRTPAQLGQDLERRLRSYVVSASALGVVLASTCSNAEIVYTPEHEVLHRQVAGTSVLSIAFNGQSQFNIYLNLGTSFSEGAEQVFGWIDAFGNPRPSNLVMETSKGSYQAALPFGALIGPAGKFQSNSARMNFCASLTGSFSSTGPWRNVTNRYLGLKFQLDGETHYGWARMNVTSGCYYTLTLTGYAYETIPNRPIVAGVLPYANGENPGAENMSTPAQSGTLGVLAAGASWRIPARTKRPQ